MKVLCVGLGLVGKLLTEFDGFDGVHHKDFNPLMLRDYDACVNTAGIVGGKCKEAGRALTFTANVEYAMYLKASCVASNTLFFQLSSTGMYMPQTCPDIEDFTLVHEDSPTKAWNLYVESKLEFEKHGSGCYIFRCPLIFDKNFTIRSKWQYVQDTYLSVLLPSDLAHHILGFIKNKPNYGIYNVASKVVYLPDLFKDQGVVIKQDHAADMTSALPIDTRKLWSCYGI